MKKHKLTLLVELSVDVELMVADGWIVGTKMFATTPNGKRAQIALNYIHSNFQRHIESEMDAMDIAAAYRDSDR